MRYLKSSIELSRLIHRDNTRFSATFNKARLFLSRGGLFGNKCALLEGTYNLEGIPYWKGRLPFTRKVDCFPGLVVSFSKKVAQNLHDSKKARIFVSKMQKEKRQNCGIIMGNYFHSTRESSA